MPRPIDIYEGETRLVQPGTKAFSRGFIRCGLALAIKGPEAIAVSHVVPPGKLRYFNLDQINPTEFHEEAPEASRLFRHLLEGAIDKPKPILVIERDDPQHKQGIDWTANQISVVQGIASAFLSDGNFPNSPEYENEKGRYYRTRIAGWNPKLLNDISIDQRLIPGDQCQKFNALITHQGNCVDISITDANHSTQELLAISLLLNY